MRPPKSCNGIFLFLVVSLAFNVFAANGASKAAKPATIGQVEQTAAYWTSEPG